MRDTQQKSRGPRAGRVRQWSALIVVLALASSTWVGCETVADPDPNNIDDLNNGDALQSQVTGRVEDDHGEPIAGATVLLYDLVANTDFVEGGDVRAQEAYIDREAILGADGALDTATTGEDGTFTFDGVFPSALLAVATKTGCTAGFAGFDEETGVLSLETLIKPDADLNFAVPTFVLACATAPEVGPDGNTPDAPAFDPPTTPPACDDATCAAAGGACDAGACVLTCQETTCSAGGGTCENGVCVVAACGAECVDAGGRCSADQTACELPACSSDEECAAGQPGAFCENPGDIDLATCRPPLPGAVVPPATSGGWTAFRLTDGDDNVLADASAENQTLAAGDLPATGLARVHGAYTGEAATGYVHVQTGDPSCPDLPPRTDYVAVELIDGELESEIYLHGGHQKIVLSTSEVLGEGDQTFVIEVGEPCTPPKHPFVVIMSWDAGPSQPADLDLNIWSSDGELVFIGNKQAAWGQLAREGRNGPGPEVFWGDDVTKGPFTIKAQFFSGRPRTIEGKVRILRIIDDVLHDDSYVFTVERPKDVAEIGVFASE